MRDERAPSIPWDKPCALGKVELRVYKRMCGFQSGGSARRRGGGGGWCWDLLATDSDRKKQASFAAEMDENMLFYTSGFVPSFPKEGRAKSRVRDPEAIIKKSPKTRRKSWEKSWGNIGKNNLICKLA